jgi:hypothetical protein
VPTWEPLPEFLTVATDRLERHHAELHPSSHTTGTGSAVSDPEEPPEASPDWRRDTDDHHLRLQSPDPSLPFYRQPESDQRL